ncbi:DUF389 domain-containing protein [Halobium salinum]|uniref:DUF389 domain-containing protein n=1 Tax=Halobium salinum TaxID=1364940 RepID=A0ABD5PEH9_9EURY|nr:DUF389 domain-containing protein [Halobium salinum]
MRQVNLRVYEKVADDVEGVLEAHGLDYVSIRDDGDEDEDPGRLFLFPLPSEAVSDVFHDLTDAGVSDDAYNVLAEASHAETPRYEEIRSEYSTELRGLSRRELHSKILEMQWPETTYYLGTILSVVVATVGLLIDSPAVVVGSMVIAPQVSSALSTTAGIIHGDWEMYVGSAKRQVVGLAVAVLAAAAFTLVVRWTGFVPTTASITSLELMGFRFAPTFLSSVAALAAGAVGAFGYMTDQTMSLVGVMIAAAIVPAAAAGGIALAWGVPLVALGALALLAVNVLAINLGAMGTLLALGYRPVWVDETRLAYSLPKRNRGTVGVVALLFTLSVVVAATLGGLHVGYERSVNGAVDETFDDARYAGVTLVSVSSQYGGVPGTTPNVTVTASRTVERSHPSLPPTVERRIEERTGRDVRVQVQYTEVRESNASVNERRARLPAPVRASSGPSKLRPLTQ